jgi:hypothetical protein
MEHIKEALDNLEQWINWAAQNEKGVKGLIARERKVLRDARAELDKLFELREKLGGKSKPAPTTEDAERLLQKLIGNEEAPLNDKERTAHCAEIATKL